MRCRVDLTTDPISLRVLAADGYEHHKLDEIGQDAIVEVGVGAIIEAPNEKDAKSASR